MNTFEDFLMETFMSDYAGPDDDSPEAFNVWMENLTQDDLIEFANKYGKIMSLSVPH